MIRDFFFKPWASTSDLFVIFLAAELGERTAPVFGWWLGFFVVVAVAYVGSVVVGLLDQVVFPVKGGKS